MVSHLSKPIDPERMVQEILDQVRQKPAPATMSKPTPAPAPATPASPPHQAALPALEGADLRMALARCGGKASVLLKVLNKFSQAQRGFQTQFAPLVSQDLDQARRTAHALKGTAANLGFAEVSKLAAALEEACTAQAPSNIDAALSNLAPILEQALDRLDVWLRQQEEAASMAYNAG